jgi:hypothetical protein
MNITNYSFTPIIIPNLIIYATIIDMNYTKYDTKYDTMDWCYDKTMVTDGFYENMMTQFMMDKTSVDWKLLSCNPMAIELLEDNIDKVVWEYFIMNPKAEEILYKYIG